jgi:hypothetical protein
MADLLSQANSIILIKFIKQSSIYIRANFARQNPPENFVQVNELSDCKGKIHKLRL